MYRCGSAVRLTADSCQQLIDAKSKSIFRPFPFFFLHENQQRGCIRVRKLGWVKERQTYSTLRASIVRKRTRFGPRVLRHPLAQVHASSFLMTCFSCAAMVFRFSKRARTYFAKCVPSKGMLKFRRARPILLFLCTLAHSHPHIYFPIWKNSSSKFLLTHFVFDELTDKKKFQERDCPKSFKHSYLF